MVDEAIFLPGLLLPGITYFIRRRDVRDIKTPSFISFKSQVIQEEVILV